MAHLVAPLKESIPAGGHVSEFAVGSGSFGNVNSQPGKETCLLHAFFFNGAGL